MASNRNIFQMGILANNGRLLFSLSTSMLLMFILSACSNNESEAYKTGWNDEYNTLTFTPFEYANKPTCEYSAKWFVDYRGLSEGDPEFRDYVRGCNDWRNSGEKGLNPK